MATKSKLSSEIKVPSPHDWRTTDADEINRRRLRAREESFRITNADAAHPIFSNFRVQSASGMTYSVEVRDLRQRHFACDCVDFRINGLGTCKHVEAVLLQLEARYKKLFRAAASQAPGRIDIVPDAATDSVRLLNGNGSCPRALKAWFDGDGLLRNGHLEEMLTVAQQLAASEAPEVRLSQELGPWLEARRRAAERKQLRREYELKV